MKAVLISIRPRHCGNIASGKKKIEVRKDKPTLETPFKCYIYCTKKTRKDGLGDYVLYEDEKGFIEENGVRFSPLRASKVIGEFVCDRIEEFHEWQLTPYGKFRDSEEEDLQKFLKDSCLSRGEVFSYRENLEYYQPLYIWHISELKIYDEPKEVSDFFRACIRDENAPCGGCPRYIEYFAGETLGYVDAECYRDIRRPPQNWMYVEEI